MQASQSSIAFRIMSRAVPNPSPDRAHPPSARPSPRRLLPRCERNRIAALAALASLAAGILPGAAAAASSTPFSIGASLVPASCNVSLSQATLDFGDIPASTLSKTTPTKLPARDVTVTVACDAPASVALAMTDNRQGSESRDIGNPTLFGLGMVNSKAVGNFTLATRNSVGDGNATDPISRIGAGAWARLSGDLSGASDYQLSWAPKGGNTPGTFTTLQQTFAVSLEIAAINDLPPLNQGVAIDGSMTFSVVYL